MQLCRGVEEGAWGGINCSLKMGLLGIVLRRRWRWTNWGENTLTASGRSRRNASKSSSSSSSSRLGSRRIGHRRTSRTCSALAAKPQTADRGNEPATFPCSSVNDITFCEVQCVLHLGFQVMDTCTRYTNTTHAHTQTDRHARTHGCAHARMPPHPPNTHAHTHTHTHTHTHAHTHSGATYRGNAVTLQKTGSMASVLASQLSDCKARDLASSARFVCK